jgi:hypothetical protein
MIRLSYNVCLHPASSPIRSIRLIASASFRVQFSESTIDKRTGRQKTPQKNHITSQITLITQESTIHQPRRTGHKRGVVAC